MLLPLQEILTSKCVLIEEWFYNQWKDLIPPVYLSCDLRHSGDKIGVVDTNLYPGGFNNLCEVYSEKTVRAFKSYFETYFPQVSTITVFAEEHTRNKFYLHNLKALQDLLVEAGFQVQLGLIGEEFTGDKIDIPLDSGNITVHRVKREGNIILCNDIQADIILSNNDFSSGVPPIFNNIDQQVIPAPGLGWHCRKKSKHFELLDQLLQSFAQEFKIDPWLMEAYSTSALDVNLTDESSIQDLAQKAESLINRISEKYKEYNIQDQPYLFLKSDAGTYGMGVIPIYSGEEILNLNRKKRNKLSSLKGGLKVSDFLLQEGIPTADSYSEQPIEPVIYAVGKQGTGGFFRIHHAKSNKESLNARGMTFSCLCMHKLDEPHEEYFLHCSEKESVVSLAYFLTKIAALAAAQEIKEEALK